MNRILLYEKNLDKNDELIDVISVSEIKIVNRERFDKLMNELKNYRNYILRGEDVEYKKYQEMSEKELRSNGYHSRYVHDYVEIYRNISTYWGMEEDTLAIFKNIRAKLVELMEKINSTSNDIEYIDLRILNDSHPLEFLEHIIKTYKYADVSSEELIYVFEEFAPQITTFATDLLDCIDFVTVEEESLSELLEKRKKYNEIVNSCKLYEPKYYEYISLIKDINNRIFTAKENSRILSLSNNIRNY